VQVVDDSAATQIEEILPHPSIACASPLPSTNMSEGMLDRYSFAQLDPSFRCLLTLS
jgi:hypothetical protein